MATPLIKYPPLRDKDILIQHLVRLGLPYLPATEANEMIVKLTVENLRLQAKLDAAKIKEGL